MVEPKKSTTFVHDIYSLFWYLCKTNNFGTWSKTNYFGTFIDTHTHIYIYILMFYVAFNKNIYGMLS